MLTAQDIIEEYESGLYTDGETVARSIRALAGSKQRHQLWRSLPDWIRQRIDEILTQFSAGDEVVPFGCEHQERIPPPSKLIEPDQAPCVRLTT